MPAPDVNALFLPDVEAKAKPSAYQRLIADARARGAEYSKIWDLFAFQPEITVHLARFTQELLRQPASISPGVRELIAAYTSHRNECAFCTNAHAAAAAELLGDEELVWQVVRDVDSAPIGDHMKTLLRFVDKVTTAPPSITRADVDAVRAAGWDDDAIYFAITTCSLFNFYNRWITATGVPAMSDEAHREQGRMLATRGYGRS